MPRLDNDEDLGIRRRQADQQPSIMKLLSITLGCITLVSLIFTVGYNWRGVDMLEKQQDQFVRKDVQSEQLRYMSQSIDELRRQLEDLRGELKAARRKE